MLLDTSGLLCLLHKDEPHHEQAKIYFGTAACLTQSYILAEFIALCNARGLPSVCIREAVCL
jgi:predicted nucleic acid-binding protein